jgi:hypothetical protein
MVENGLFNLNINNKLRKFFLDPKINFLYYNFLYGIVKLSKDGKNNFKYLNK